MVEMVYLDYNATTPVAPEVIEEMLPWMSAQFWNAASAHSGGRAAATAVKHARTQLAELLRCSPQALVWTSGSTEANNLAIKGAVSAGLSRARVLVAATEHKAVLDVAHSLDDRCTVVELPVLPNGVLDLDVLREQLRDDVAVVSVMLANNETGVIQPLAEVARLAHGVGALVHTDATQAVGKIGVDVSALDVDLASMSAHKFYGPKGVGALYVRRGVRIDPILHGGGHERGHRSGTLNVPGIVGMGAAAALAASRLDQDAVMTGRLVARLVDGLCARLDDVQVVARSATRLPNTVNLHFSGADAEAVMANATIVCISSGSACTAMVPDASHVLMAMGMSQEHAFECLRFSVGRSTSEAEIDAAVQAIACSVHRVRELNDYRPTQSLEGVNA